MYDCRDTVGTLGGSAGLGSIWDPLFLSSEFWDLSSEFWDISSGIEVLSSEFWDVSSQLSALSSGI